MKRSQKHIHGFTLIEMIVVITLIGIFTLGITNIDFSRLSVRQKHEIFTNDIITNIETVRNFAFQGKGIGASLETPDQWSIEISANGNGAILTQYSWGINGIYEPTSFVVPNGYEITNLLCTDLERNSVENISGTGTIIFTNTTASLIWCDPRLKVMELTAQHSGYSHTIEINTINGIIQKQ